jgi:type I restriction enzyme M protein
MPKTESASPTATESLSALLTSTRDIIRKDKGLSGDLERLPLLNGDRLRVELDAAVRYP